jgi:NTF2 fold immunity protein
MAEQDESPPIILLLHKFARGGVIFDAAMACSIAEILFACHYGDEELARQSPVTAVDNGDYWRVEGSVNDSDARTTGPLFLSIMKFDGQIKDFGRFGPPPDPDLLARIEAMSPKEK